MHGKGVVVAGLAGGSGKSVVSVGLTAYLAKKGLKTVPFKKALIISMPDGWLRQQVEIASILIHTLCLKMLL